MTRWMLRHDVVWEWQQAMSIVWIEIYVVDEEFTPISKWSLLKYVVLKMTSQGIENETNDYA